jgi:hypothetical protein
MAENPGTLDEQQQKPTDILSLSKKQVISLPKNLPEGSSEGPIARYFADLTFEPDEGVYCCVDMAWT